MCSVGLNRNNKTEYLQLITCTNQYLHITVLKLQKCTITNAIMTFANTVYMASCYCVSLCVCGCFRSHYSDQQVCIRLNIDYTPTHSCAIGHTHVLHSTNGVVCGNVHCTSTLLADRECHIVLFTKPSIRPREVIHDTLLFKTR